ncbi:energy-coupling factor transporter transmembrane component T family protein [Microbacterium marinilacus]|uniref:Energy-coupling factor transporter transmembrane component T n=1 Tax=Microbacterium marinilacus TaxID=415209 RepID=A0ABP7B7D1_9MICO|nr:energy-coupling factor transporter transmembrane component T [Microbacterium marinilacus]MBY0687385.1 energy-coupling factor transporter transmembrane protein EcfT [Microbacterium marinilacus]
MSLVRKQHDVLSVEWIKLELIRTAYATRGGLFAAMDPRVVIGWYALMALSPWFTHNLTVVGGLFVVASAAVALARVGPLVLGLFVIGLGFELVYLVLAATLFGGDLTTFVALTEVTLKLGVLSLASLAAFVSLDPEKLSDALLAMRFPSAVAFAVSYGYRMMPILVEEFSTVLEGYRLRQAPPASGGLLGWRHLVHWATIAVKAFYPIFLNTAKSVRTTVEALEARGFTFASIDRRGRDIRLGSLRMGWIDLLVVLATLALVAACYAAGAQWPLFRG